MGKKDGTVTPGNWQILKMQLAFNLAINLQFSICTPGHWGFPHGSDGKEFACSVGYLGSIPGLGIENLFKDFEFGIFVSILAVQYSQVIVASQKPRENLEQEGSGTPLQHSCLENPTDRGAWWAAVHGVAKNWTRLSDFTFTFHFHALEKEMATHSGVLAWRVPGTREPMGLHRVGHD